jgi:hypothetical protein
MRCTDGSLKWISDRGIAQRDADERLIGMTGSGSDISERQRMEQAPRGNGLGIPADLLPPVIVGDPA